MNHKKQVAGSSNPSSQRKWESETRDVIDLAAERSRRVESERRRGKLEFQDLPLIGPNRLAVDYLKVA